MHLPSDSLDMGKGEAQLSKLARFKEWAPKVKTPTCFVDRRFLAQGRFKNLFGEIGIGRIRLGRQGMTLERTTWRKQTLTKRMSSTGLLFPKLNICGVPAESRHSMTLTSPSTMSSTKVKSLCKRSCQRQWRPVSSLFSRATPDQRMKAVQTKHAELTFMLP